ncbi:hypothetical protein ACHAXS_006218 [Conticribra weissflogii]
MCPAFVQSKLDVSMSPKSIEVELATATGTNNYFCKKNKISRKIITRTIITRNARFPSSAEKVPKHKISSTELNLKFKTFDEMLEHHAEVPLLINFYASFCGPCKLMKQELTSIRPTLDTMGPIVTRNDALATGSVNSGEGGDCVDADGDGSLDCSVDSDAPIARTSVANTAEAAGQAINPRQSREKPRISTAAVAAASSSSSIKGTATKATNIQVALSRIQSAKTTTTSSTSVTDSTPNSSTERKTMASNIPGKPTGIPIFHVNTERFPQVGAKNKIHGLPTLVLFWAGKEVWRQEGVASGEDILRELRGIECCCHGRVDHEMDDEKSDQNRLQEIHGSIENDGERMTYSEKS